MAADPARASNLFTQFHCQGVWKSADYGVTWSGPINNGRGGAGSAEREGSPSREVRTDSPNPLFGWHSRYRRWVSGNPRTGA
jgi:hypothetical protein